MLSERVLIYINQYCMIIRNSISIQIIFLKDDNIVCKNYRLFFCFFLIKKRERAGTRVANKYPGLISSYPVPGTCFNPTRLMKYEIFKDTHPRCRLNHLTC